MENTNSKTTAVFPGTFAKPKDENIGTFLEKLSKLPSKAVVLHSHPEQYTSFVPNFKQPVRAKFPNSLRDLIFKKLELSMKNLKSHMTYDRHRLCGDIDKKARTVQHIALS